MNSLLCNDKNIGLHGKMAAWEAESSVLLLTNLRNILTTTFNQCCTFLRLLFISFSSSGACLNSGFIMNKTEAKYFNCVKNDNVKIDAACLPGLEEEKVAKIFWYIQ